MKLQKITLITLLVTYFLIFVGGLVRSTGAGMGCPDWPKCFGQWIPPTDISQLPENYKDTYSNKRKEKNLKLVKYFNALGMNDVAVRLQNDKSIYVEQDFNTTKTWIEYLNRLVGVVVGFLVLGTFVASLNFWKKDKKIPIMAFLVLVLTGFQGWVGSVVVSTNLIQGTITFHMFLAILMMGILTYLLYIIDYQKDEKIQKAVSPYFKLSLLVGTVCILGQILLGTQVREQIDAVATRFNETQRDKWVEEAGVIFIVHRTFSWLILLVTGFLWYLSHKNEQKIIRNMANLLAAFVVFEILTGVVMAYFAIPAFAQPLHLLWALGILGLQWNLFLRTTTKIA